MHDICTYSTCSKGRIQIHFMFGQIWLAIFIDFIDVRMLLVAVKGHHQQNWFLCCLWQIMPGLLTANWVQVTLVCRMVLSKCETNLQDVGNDCHLLIWAADPRPQRPQRCRPHAHAVVNNSDVFSQSGFLWETTEATGMAEWDSVINHVEVPGALFLGVLCFKEANQSTRKLRNCIYTAGHSLGNMLWHVCRPGSNMTWCWRVHPRFFEKQPWFEDLSPEDARFWAHAGGVADLSDVVLRNNEMRGGFFKI